MRHFYLGFWITASSYNRKSYDTIEGLFLFNTLRLNMNNNYGSTECKYTLKAQTVNKIWAHLHYEESTGTSYGELECNGERFYQAGTRSSSAYAIGADVEALKTIAFGFPKSYPCYLSNVIISDTEISPKEQVIALPTSETVTDMTSGETGIYIADAVNQTLLQTVDMSTLIENYGASSAVTGIALVGNPAYTTGTALASMIGITNGSTEFFCRTDFIATAKNSLGNCATIPAR